MTTDFGTKVTWFFFGALLVVFIRVVIILLFEDKPKKAQQTTPGNSPTPTPKESFWKRFLTWVGIKKKRKPETEVEEYRERLGWIGTIVIILSSVGIILILNSMSCSSSKKTADPSPSPSPSSSWFTDLIHNQWSWIILAGVVVLITLIVLFSKKKPKGEVFRKWFLGLLFIAVVAYILLGWRNTSLSDHYRDGKEPPQSVKTDRRDAYPDLNKNGENNMHKGDGWFQFTLQRGDPKINFKAKIPIGDTAIYYFEKKDPSQHFWLIKWNDDSTGYKWVPREPIDDIMVGKFYMRLENRSAVVKVNEVKK